MEDIEDIYIFEVNTKYISSSVLKIPMFSTHEMKYIWYLPIKSKFSFFFILFRRFTVDRVTVFRTKRQNIVCDRIPHTVYPVTPNAGMFYQRGYKQ